MATQNLEFIVKPFDALTTKELYSILHVRAEVFVLEQTCFYSDLDNKDDVAIHVFNKDERGIPAYLRIFPPGIDHKLAVIGRVLTRMDMRGTGLGRKIVAFAIDYIRKNMPSAGIKISAQSHLKRFYGELGFVSVGEDYLEDGIPHIEMKLVFS